MMYFIASIVLILAKLAYCQDLGLPWLPDGTELYFVPGFPDSVKSLVLASM